MSAVSRAWLCASLVAALGALARAQESPEAQLQAPEAPAPEAEARPRIAVMLLATSEIDPATLDALNELLVSALASRGGMTIVGREEASAQLAQDDARILECIGSLPCLGRIGVQLSVAELIAGTLSRHEDRWVFNLNRFDVQGGELVGRVFREVDGDLGAVADALQESFPMLYQRQRRPAALVVSADAPGAELLLDGEVIGTIDGELRREGIAPGSHQVQVRAPGRRSSRHTIVLHEGGEAVIEARLPPAVIESISPWVWLWGAVGVAAIAVAIPLGVSSQSSLDLSGRRMFEPTRADALSFYAARQAEAVVADALYIAALLAVGATITQLFFPDRQILPDVAAVPVPGGAMALLRSDL